MLSVHSIVISGAQEIIGTVLSSTVKSLVAVDTFPQTSVAVNVTVIVWLQFPVGGVYVGTSVTAPPQLSVALAVAAQVATVAALKHSIVSDAAGTVITGGVLSSTVKSLVAVDTFPQTSVAVNVTVIVWLQFPVGGVYVGTSVTAPPQLSVALAVAAQVATVAALKHSIVSDAAGTVITGGVLSSTVKSLVAVDTFPQTSVAVNVTVIVWLQFPVGGVYVGTSVTAPPQLSVALAVAAQVATVAALKHSIVSDAAGTVITGGVLSSTVKSLVAVDTFPQTSVAVNVTVIVWLQFPVGGVYVGTSVTAPPQLSVALAVAAQVATVAALKHSIVSDAAGTVITGGVLSSTVKSLVAVDTFPQTSVAVNVTVIVWLQFPVGGVYVGTSVTAPPQLSVALAVAAQVATVAALKHSIVSDAAGTVITGGVLSSTVKSLVAVDTFPQTSVAVNVTVIVWLQFPVGGVYVGTSVTAPPQLSVALAVAAQVATVAALKHSIVSDAAGTVITGGVLSSTVKSLVAVDTFPQTSVAVNVTVIVWLQFPVGGVYVGTSVTAPPQLSVALAVAAQVATVAALKHSIVSDAAGTVITGGVLSSTVKSLVAVDTFPQTSVAVNVTVIVWLQFPVGGVYVGTSVTAPPQLSVALAVAAQVATVAALKHSIVSDAAGTVITGGVLSSTVKSLVAVDTFPQTSVAVNVTVIVWLQFPVGGVYVGTSVTAPPQLSVALAVAAQVATVAALKHSIVSDAAGTVITGGVLSSTVKSLVAVDTFPQTSVAVNVTVIVWLQFPVGGVYVGTSVTAPPQLSVALAVAAQVATVAALKHSIVSDAAGTVITGGVLSSTVKSLVAVDTFPQTSVAVNVTVIVWLQFPVGGVYVGTSVTAPPQLSVALAVAAQVATVAALKHSIVSDAAGTVITGGVLSSTVKSLVAVDTFPQTSVAVNVTVIVWLQFPVGGVYVGTSVTAPPQLSVALAVAAQVATVAALKHSIVSDAAGTVITGGVLSSTVKSLVAVDTFPQTSVAVNVTVIVWLQFPVGGVYVGTSVTAPPQLSVALAVAAQVATVAALKHSIVSDAAGTVITGGVLSSTVKSLVAVDTFPQTSVAVNVTVIVWLQFPVGGVYVGTSVTAPPQLSVALAVAAQVATVAALKHSIVSDAAGTVITGGVLSSTVKSLVAVDTFPQTSVAVNVTVIVWLQFPVGGVYVGTSVTAPPQLSVALAVAAQVATVAALKHSIVSDAAGTVITGGVLSSTIMVCVKFPLVLPQLSVKFQVLI